MKKLIVFEEEEFKNKLLEFVDNFIKFSRKGYGAKLVSNEGNEIVDENMKDEKELLCGYFHLIWDETFQNKD